LPRNPLENDYRRIRPFDGTIERATIEQQLEVFLEPGSLPDPTVVWEEGSAGDPIDAECAHGLDTSLEESRAAPDEP
jgi:hypothetical protein